MFDLPDELKKISAGMIETNKNSKQDEITDHNDHRGRGSVEEISISKLDKQEKRALKKRKYRERKKEEKRKAM